MAEDKNKLSIKKPVIIFLLVIVGLLLAFWMFESLKYESTDDAYVETTTVSVAPRVSGEIIEVYVKDNQQVKKGDVVGIIEAMKLMNEVVAPQDGVILSIDATDGNMVQYGQVLFTMK